MMKRDLFRISQIYFSKLRFPCPIFHKVLRIFCNFNSLYKPKHFYQPELRFAKLHDFCI